MAGNLTIDYLRDSNSYTITSPTISTADTLMYYPPKYTQTKWLSQDDWYKKSDSAASTFAKDYLNSYTDFESITASTYNTLINNKERSPFADIRWDDTGELTYQIREPYAQYYKDSWDGIKWAPPKTPEERLREMIQKRMAPVVIVRGRKRESLSFARDEREKRARETLRRIIGEQAFRRFIRDGFITVVPRSGLTYRIYWSWHYGRI